MYENILKLHSIEEKSQLNNYLKQIIKYKFSVLIYNDSEFSYSVVCSNIYNENDFFFDSEIESIIDSNTAYKFTFHYPENVKFLILFHDITEIAKEDEFLIKHYIVAYQKLSLIKYYENSLIVSRLQLDFLNEIGDLLGNFDLQIVLTKILENAVNLVDGDVGVIFLKDKENLVEKISWGVPKGVLTKIKNKFLKKSIIDEIFETKETILIEDISKDTTYDFELKGKYLINSFIGLPIYTKNRNLGVLALVNFEIDIDFTEVKIATLETLTQIASIGIENAIFFKDSIEKEKLLTELNIAANLQKQLLPEENFSTDKFFIGGFSIPARNVGGDFFNYIIDEEKNNLIAFVGDVAGKGIPAALLTTMAMSLLKTLISEFDNLKDVTFKINNIISKENLGEKYFTLGIININLNDYSAYLVNAGHTEILHFDYKNKTINKFESSNLPIGMFEDVEYEDVKLKLNKGDLLFFFSDGIPDAINENNERYELERLINLILKIYNHSPEEIKLKILNDVQKFCGNAEQFDDLTLMIIKIL